MIAKSSTVLAAIAVLGALTIPTILVAQQSSEHSAATPRYSLQVLGTLGGSFSEGHGLNNSSSVPGQAFVSGDTALHAFLWRKGTITDLGTLGGPDSLVSIANHSINQKDAVVGVSELSTPDPNGEDFCGLGTFLICLPFVWENGAMAPLPTLGGNNGQASGINNQGQIAGQVEAASPDPCSPFALQIEAVIWKDGEIQQILPPLDGGSTATGASAINDNGDVVGLSGCITTVVHGVLWHHGKPIDLGTLGGSIGLPSIPFDINNRGQIVGQSDLPGDTIHHGFLWQDGVMTDLGNLPGLPISLANAINNKGQVVGFSQDANGDDFSAVAVLWENGTITDLNTLIPVGSPLFLMEAVAINDRGQIAGWGHLADGEHRPFLLTPCEGECQISEETSSELSAERTGFSKLQLPTAVWPRNSHFPFMRMKPSY
jgi:probable HAF family extracellular repeat protein